MKHFSILFAALLLAAGAASAQGLPGTGALFAVLDSSYTIHESNPDDRSDYLVYKHTFCPDGRVQEDSVMLLTYTSEGDLTLDPYRVFQYTYDADGRLNGYTRYYNTSGSWKGSVKYDLTFNAEGLLVDSIDYAWRNNAWSPAEKYSYTYADGRVSVLTQAQYQEQSWVENLRREFTYNADGKLLSRYDYELKWGEWQQGYTQEYTYDDRGRLILRLDNSGSSQWRYEYTYLSDTTYTHTYTYLSDGVVMGRSETECTTDAAGRLIYELNRKVDSDGVRTNYRLMKYAYNDQGRQILFELYFWQNDNWNGSKKSLITSLDAFGNVLEEVVSTRYDQTAQQFISYSVNEYFYTYVYPSALDAVGADDAPAQKFFRDGRILIRRGDRIYDLNGRMVE